ncbi:hypothetical protein EYC80_004270 [Monilinia laxa]|uniref:Uncharacterized protein n=1 Tax=Monilinia laxa TaxID=61186 RepID=A0A5N6KMB8_MONLA|nr:hypothetical protein EYC80_004270 [Monilinia laxa]
MEARIRDIGTLEHRTFRYLGRTTLDGFHDGHTSTTKGLALIFVLHEVIFVIYGVCSLPVMEKRCSRYRLRQLLGVTTTRYLR